MELAIHYMDFDRPGGAAELPVHLRATAAAAEAVGCSDFTLMDHYFQMEAHAAYTDPMIEGYTGLSYLAGLTTQVNLGLLVTGVTYRHPGLLAKIIASLDVLSGGRAFLGIGAAWYQREHLGLGVPFPEVPERFTMLEESLQIVRQMWSADDGPFNGAHYILAETLCRPTPLSTPRPRILVGGNGERKTLRLAASYADAVNLLGSDPDTAEHKLAVLARHCDAVGTDYHAIQKSVLVQSFVLDDVDGFLALMQRYAAIGVQKVWLPALTDNPAAWVTEVAEAVVPRMADMGG